MDNFSNVRGLTDKSSWTPRQKFMDWPTKVRGHIYMYICIYIYVYIYVNELLSVSPRLLSECPRTFVAMSTFLIGFLSVCLRTFGTLSTTYSSMSTYLSH